MDASRPRYIEGPRLADERELATAMETNALRPQLAGFRLLRTVRLAPRRRHAACA